LSPVWGHLNIRYLTRSLSTVSQFAMFFCRYGMSMTLTRFSTPFIPMLRYMGSHYIDLDSTKCVDHTDDMTSTETSSEGEDDILSENLNALEITESPRQRKRVTFADSIGLELEKVRHITAGRDTPPDLSNYTSTLQEALPPSPPPLTAQFIQPISNYVLFRASLSKNSVCLENISIADRTIVGMIKVRNIDFHKTVYVRYTCDNWRTSSDVPAHYVNALTPTGQATEFDSFTFTLEIPTLRGGASLEFCICFQCQGSQFWDNNNGTNYKVSCSNGQWGDALANTLRSSRPNSLLNDDNWTEFAIWRRSSNDVPYW